MGNEKLSRQAGLFAMLGSLLWVVCGTIVSFVGGGSRAEAVLRTVLLNPALLLLIVGLMGFHKRQAKRSGRLGAAGFALCLLGTGIILLGNIAEIWVYKSLYGILEARWTPGWRAMGVGLVMLPAGLFLLGIGTIRARVFTGWRRGAPLGFSVMLAAGVILLILSYVSPTAHWEPLLATVVQYAASYAPISVMTVFAFGWAALGYALWSEKAA